MLALTARSKARGDLQQQTGLIAGSPLCPIVSTVTILS